MTWQTELVKRYPLLFQSDEPAHARGCPTVGDGWHLVVEKAIERIDAAVAGLPRGSLQIVQIKEKFAGLRLYVEWAALLPEVAAKVQEAIDLAEARSYCTCETCGAVGRLYDDDGWFTTRCDRHAEGAPVPATPGDDGLHIKFTVELGKMRVINCRRYDRERDAFVDAPLPPGEEWAEER